jgi:hypothetical protein
MSQQHPQVLYIGANPADIEPFASHVHVAFEAMEALAIIVTYMPDAVVIEMDHPIAEEVLSHLESADWFTTPVVKINSRTIIESELSQLFTGEAA